MHVNQFSSSGSFGLLDPKLYQAYQTHQIIVALILFELSRWWTYTEKATPSLHCVAWGINTTQAYHRGGWRKCRPCRPWNAAARGPHPKSAVTNFFSAPSRGLFRNFLLLGEQHILPRIYNGEVSGGSRQGREP